MERTSFFIPQILCTFNGIYFQRLFENADIHIIIHISLEDGFDILGGRPARELTFIHDIDHGFPFPSGNRYHDIFLEIVVRISLIYVKAVFICWLNFPYKDRYGGTLLSYDCGV